MGGKGRRNSIMMFSIDIPDSQRSTVVKRRGVETAFRLKAAFIESLNLRIARGTL